MRRVARTLCGPLVLAALLLGPPPRQAGAAAPDPTSTDPRAVMTPPDTLSPDSVAGFDAGSHATVTVTMGHLTLDIPRNMLAGMFVNPLYCPSERAVCGKVYAPQLAFLYPGMMSNPQERVAEFRVLSAAGGSNCDRGVKEIEKFVCKNKILFQDNEIMLTALRNRIADLSANQSSALLYIHHTWLNSRVQRCGAASLHYKQGSDIYAITKCLDDYIKTISN